MVDSIHIQYSFDYDSEKKFLCVKVMDTVWERQMPVLFGEVAEALVKGPYENICFDFSSLHVVASTVFSMCVKCVKLAGSSDRIKLRFSREGAEVAHSASLDQLARIEVVE